MLLNQFMVEFNSLNILNWSLKDLIAIKRNKYKVLVFYPCAGGSIFGYELAGFNVIGFVQKDHLLKKHIFLNSRIRYLHFVNHAHLRNQNKLWNLPDIDILHGGIPFETFTDKKLLTNFWGKDFRKGDRILKFIEAADNLRPKIVIAETYLSNNELGKEYAFDIKKRLIKAGYNVQAFDLDAANMGLPQHRARTFFIGLRRNLELPPISFDFNDAPVPVINALSDVTSQGVPISSDNSLLTAYEKCRAGDFFSLDSGKTYLKLPKDTPSSELPLSYDSVWHYDLPRPLEIQEVLRLHSFPFDYVFDKLDRKQAYELITRSTPPLMIYKIAKKIEKHLEWCAVKIPMRRSQRDNRLNVYR
jgi:DNA (cytosine-5)-methyltransferase 1